MSMWRLFKKSPVAQLLVVLTALNLFMLGNGSAEARTPDRAPAEATTVEAQAVPAERDGLRAGADASLPDTMTVAVVDGSELGLPDTATPWLPQRP